MYGLTQPIISDTGLKSPFTNYFNGSPIQLLEFLYPDNNWLFWEFVSAPNNAWDIYENQRKFMDYIMKDKSISYLPNLNVRQDLPHGLTMKFNCLFELAKTIYPEIAWNKNDFDKNNKTQKWLNYCLNKADFIFSNEIPICNSLKKSVFRMDIYLEQINTIIEIDGVQHFEKVDYLHDTQERFAKRQKHDKIKKEKCKKYNVILLCPTYKLDESEYKNHIEKVFNNNE